MYNMVVPDMEALTQVEHFRVLSQSTEPPLEEGKREVFLPQHHPSLVVVLFSSMASTSGILNNYTST